MRWTMPIHVSGILLSVFIGLVVGLFMYDKPVENTMHLGTPSGSFLIESDQLVRGPQMEIEAALRTYMLSNFGMPRMRASWFEKIEEYRAEIHEKSVTLKVMMLDSASREDVQAVYNAVQGFAKTRLPESLQPAYVVVTDTYKKERRDATPLR
ncbi:hypothetical protein [Aneurinibacillus uraniidurans]|uniref:hypothetical protein n=1 Tax=Aneurinibacillus uraniidurans TaxID=2966586 RepID=UPI00234A242E|nr:hypothetical protein [Aneurinibacillus sp. B1]WCN39454.1 hypothetical protein PO771_08700 [Aneurinibacillus sp. B1]